MNISIKLLLFVWGVVIVVAGTFTYLINDLQKSQYLSGIDKLLYSSALMAREIMGGNYHDQLADKNSIPPVKYLEIIDRYNKLCKKIGLQYLWSNMWVDGDIVFTSSTSTSKEVENGDHALFFDVHSNPKAFDKVVERGTTSYSTFQNEWGKGRMVLIPFFDRHGRRYVFGASISINEIDQKLTDVDARSYLIFLGMLVVGGLASIFIGSTITRPIRAISNVAKDIAEGDYGKNITYRSGGAEIKSLTNSINHMSESIFEHNNNLESLVKDRTQELEIKEKQLLESHAREHYASKMASLGEMASNIGHEINSPLQSISLLAYRTKMKVEKGDASDIKQLMDNVTSTVGQIAKIVESLRKLTRDSFNDPYEETQIKSIIDDVCSITRERFKVNDVDFQLKYLGKSEQSSAVCQYIQIAQVLVNLLNNAYDAVKELDTKWVRLEVADTGELISFSVIDSGSGLSKGLENKIFEPLFTTKEIGKGTGIGLSISLEIAKKHNGFLYLDPHSKNTTFVLEIPKLQPKVS